MSLSQALNQFAQNLGRYQKGLCHMLVNDHMLEWVHENE